MASPLSENTFREVIRCAPLVSIDLVVRRPDGRYLVGWRRNRPAAAHWFVPGGRIFKNERILDAFARLTAKELGEALPWEGARLLGAYDHIYDDTVFGDGDGGTHYVVLAHWVPVPEGFEPRVDPQHDRFTWLLPSELMTEPTVHANTRAYFPAAEELFTSLASLGS